MNKSDSITKLAEALSAFQGELKPAKKDEVNPFFKSKYADLASIYEVIREPLAKHGLSVAQLPYVWNDDKVILTTMLLHSSGEWLSSELLVTPVKANDPQSMGSALTYARRYALGAILGVAAEEDDDAETASGRGQVKPEGKPGPKTKVEEHWCAKHNVAFREMHDMDGKSHWYSHKLADGGWCNEKKEVKVEKETKEVKAEPEQKPTPEAPELKSSGVKEKSNGNTPDTAEIMADLKILFDKKIWTTSRMMEELSELGGTGAKVNNAVQSLSPDKLLEFHEIVRKVLPKEVK